MFGQTGIGMGMGIGFIISSLFAFAYYQFGKWDQKLYLKIMIRKG